MGFLGLCSPAFRAVWQDSHPRGARVLSLHMSLPSAVLSLPFAPSALFSLCFRCTKGSGEGVERQRKVKESTAVERQRRGSERQRKVKERQWKGSGEAVKGSERSRKGSGNAAERQ